MHSLLHVILQQEEKRQVIALQLEDGALQRKGARGKRFSPAGIARK